MARQRTNRRVRVRHALVAILACLLALGFWLAVDPPNQSGSVSPEAPWKLTAQLIGPQFRLANGNPSGVAGVTCGTRSLCFLSTGYGADQDIGGAIYVSHNGGVTWRATRLPIGVAATTTVSCASANWCAAGGGRFDRSLGFPSAGKPARDAELLVTTDEGAHWSVTAIPLPTTAIREGGQGDVAKLPGTVDAISCGAPNSCLTIANVQVPSRGRTRTWRRLVSERTTDGGRHWTPTGLPGQASKNVLPMFVQGSSAVSLSCPQPNSCDVAAAPIAETGKPNQFTLDLWHTGDGGATWRLSKGPVVTALLSPVSCPDLGHCVVLAATPDQSERTSYNVVLLGTVDGGSSWSSVSLPPGVWESASCSSSTNCYIGGARLDETVDSGKHWRGVPLPSRHGEQVAEVAQISCSNDGACEALADSKGDARIGDYGTLVLTNAAN